MGQVLSSLILCNNKSFLYQIVICNEKWIVYNNRRQPAQQLDWEAPKHFPKPNLNQKNIIATVWWSVAHLMHYSFLNPSETITSEKCVQQTIKTHRKLQCPQPISVYRKGQILLHDNAQLPVAQPMLQKLNELVYNFASSATFTWPLVNRLPLLQASQQFFAGKMLPQPAGGRKCFPRVCQILKHRFYATEISKRISHWFQWFLFRLIKMCLSLVIMI